MLKEKKQYICFQLEYYIGVIFPEGFLAPDKMFLFNNEQITQVYALGYQDAEQIAFKERADEAIKNLRK